MSGPVSFCLFASAISAILKVLSINWWCCDDKVVVRREDRLTRKEGLGAQRSSKVICRISHNLSHSAIYKYQLVFHGSLFPNLAHQAALVTSCIEDNIALSASLSQYDTTIQTMST